MSKKILLLCGPQGSGNHLWSKIFALHPDVSGWDDLLDTSDPDNYLIPHWREPHINIWDNIEGITKEIMGNKDYLVISASVPYWNREKIGIPEIDKFVEHMEYLGIEVQVCVIGRDRNILAKQQTRLRGGPSYGAMTQMLYRMFTLPFYLSTENLYLYRQRYLKSLAKWLDFPIVLDDPRIDEILKEDSNEKYIIDAENPFVDSIVRKVTWVRHKERQQKVGK